MEGNLPFLLCFTLYLTAISKPSGGLYLDGRFNGGFFALRDWEVLIQGGAYFRNFMVYSTVGTQSKEPALKIELTELQNVIFWVFLLNTNFSRKLTLFQKKLCTFFSIKFKGEWMVKKSSA